MPLLFPHRSAAHPVAGGLALLALSRASRRGQRPAGPGHISPVGTTAAYFTVTVPAGGSQRLTRGLVQPRPLGREADTYAANVYSMVNGGFGAGLQGQARAASPPGSTTRPDGPPRPRDAASNSSFTSRCPRTPPRRARHQPGRPGTGPGDQRGAVALAQVTRQALPIVIDVPGP